MKRSLKLSILLFLMTISLMNTSFPMQAKTANQSSSATLSGSLLTPSYMYISGQTMDNAKNKQFSVTSNNQAGYFNPITYDGNSYSSNSQLLGYLPANFNNTGVNSLNSIFNFPTSSTPASQRAYFLEYGNVVPTTSELDQISNPLSPNYISSPNYLAYAQNYPFHDANYRNKTTTSLANLQISVNSNEATINTDNWFKFDLNQSSSYSIILQAPVGIYGLVLIQNYGSTSTNYYGTGLLPSSNLNLNGASSQYVFLSTLSASDNLLHIELSASVQSEIYIEVKTIGQGQTDLTFNNKVEFKHDIKASDETLSSDPFRMVANSQIMNYKFVVPNNLAGKYLSIMFDYNSIYNNNGNAVAFSETSNKQIPLNSPFLATKGEVIDVVFVVVSYDAYYFSLQVVQSQGNQYFIGTNLDLALSYSSANYYFNVSSDTILTYDLDTATTYYYYSYFYIYNASGYSVAYGSGSGSRVGVFKAPAGFYTIYIYGQGITQFSLHNQSVVNFNTNQEISYRNGALFSTNSFTPYTYNNFIITVPGTNINSQINGIIYSSNMNSVVGSFYQTMYTTTVTSQVYIGNPGLIYIYLYASYVYPTNQDTVSVMFSVGGTSSNGNQSSNGQQVNVNYNTPGTFSINSGDYGVHNLLISFSELNPKTWNIITINPSNVYTNTGFTLSILPQINLNYYSLNYFPDYRIFMENNIQKQSFGFGALANSATLSLSIYGNGGSGSFIVSVKQMNTSELILQKQQLGTIIPPTSPNISGNQGSSTPGFEFVSVFVMVVAIISIRKMRRHN